MSKNSVLLQPIKVGNFTLKNRIMFPPLTTGYEERDGSIGERSLGFYTRLAKGGVGYVVLGDVAPVRTASPTPRIDSDSQIPSFKKLADSLHQYDCKVGLQLYHPEYDVVAVGKLIMQSQMAAMAAKKAQEVGDNETFAAKMAESQTLGTQARQKLHNDMTHFVTDCTADQLAEIKNYIAEAARRAQDAEIDAIEVHGDRIIGSLCSTILNHRTDEYGGCFENRVRFALEVVKAIKERAPKLFIEYKLPIVTVNADGSLRGKGGLLAEEAVELAKLLEEAGVDMIQVAQANHTGNMGDTIPPMGSAPYNWTLYAAEMVKKAVSIPVATVGRVVSVEAGEEIVESGKADIIGYGRSLCCDPDIANKIETGEPIRECINCNKGCVDSIMGRRYISCVLNAENGDETTISLKPSDTSKNVAVVGGGIAGLEAARVAAKRGHKVTLFEATDKLGGQINIASVPPRKSEMVRSIEYYEKILPTLNVEVKLNTVADATVLNTFDQVVVAVGGQNTMLRLAGNTENVVSSWDILAGKTTVSGKVAVIGGGLVGAETAEYLLNNGCEVTVVEMLDKIAAQESSTVLPLMMADFTSHNAVLLTNTKVESISEDGHTLVATDTKENKTVEIPCDYIVMAVGSRKVAFEAELTVPVVFVGDCSGERTADISSAVRTAYHAANEI